jgi:hypothetical protein
MTEFHIIITTDPYTNEHRRHDLPGTREEAENEARERHDDAFGVHTEDVIISYYGTEYVSW